MTNIIERFMNHVMPEPNTGCWLWGGYINKFGYGRFAFNGKICGSHRVSYKLFNGEINGLDVCHTCDVRSCVNPNHLFLGTHKDNVRDMFLKGRAPKRYGEFAAKTNLKDEQVLEIRSSDLKPKEISKKYNVSVSAISKIKKGITWKHLK